MKQVSEAYKTSMAEPLRNRSRAKIRLQHVDTTAISDGTWSDSGHAPWSDTTTLANDYAYAAGIATLELNRWSLDGSWAVSSGNIRKDGYVSNIMSDEDGELSTAVTLDRTYANTHDTVGLTVIFDSRAEECPVEAELKLYSGQTLIDTVTVDNESSSMVSIQYPVQGITKVVIKPTKLLPYRRFRVETMLLGVMIDFTDNDILQIDQAHDVDPICRRLPSETLTFTVLDLEHNYDSDNPTGIWEYVNLKSPVSVTYGYDLDDDTTEWLPTERYLLNSKPSTIDDKVSFSAIGMVGAMTDVYYKSQVGNKSLYDMAVDVLQDANIGKSIYGTDPWVIDSSLSSIYTTAILPVDTHANCLQMIAHAARCRLYTDYDNIVHIEPIGSLSPSSAQDFHIDFGSITMGTLATSKVDALKAVTVEQYTYTPSIVEITIFDENTTETFLHVEFDAPATDIVVTVNADCTKTIYAHAVDITGMPTGSKHVVIKGKTVETTKTAVTLNVSDNGEVDSEQNKLVTTASMRNALARHVRDYLALRNTYELNYRGNPELETGDIITLQTRFSDRMPVLVLKDTIKYSGALSGSLMAKGLIR